MRRAPAVLTLIFLINSAAEAQFRPNYELALVDLSGQKKVIGVVSGTVFAPRVSPDGRHIALDIIDPSNATAVIWIAELEDVDIRYALPQVNGTRNYGPAWTPDGERIVFLASTPEGDTIYWQRADGSGDAQYLLDARAPESWVTEGSALTYLTLGDNQDYGISLLDLGTRLSRTLVDLPGSAEHSSNVSPDGRYIVYVSNAPGQYEIFVEPLPQTGRPLRLTSDGGAHPLWAPDGRTIYFDNAGSLSRIGFDPSTGRPAGAAEALPIAGFVQGPLRRQFDLMPDGERFLMLYLQSDE